MVPKRKSPTVDAEQLAASATGRGSSEGVAVREVGEAKSMAEEFAAAMEAPGDTGFGADDGLAGDAPPVTPAADAAAGTPHAS